MGMSELDILQTFILFYKTVTDNLDLRLMRNGLEIRMKNRALCIDSLPMTVRACSFRIETLSDFVLSFGRDVTLVFEDEDLMGEEGFTDYVKVGIWKKSVVDH